MFQHPLAAIHKRAGKKKSVTATWEFDIHRHHSTFLTHNQDSKGVKVAAALISLVCWKVVKKWAI